MFVGKGTDEAVRRLTINSVSIPLQNFVFRLITGQIFIN